MADWLWANRDKIDTDEAVDMLENLADLQSTKGQAVMLSAITHAFIQKEATPIEQ